MVDVILLERVEKLGQMGQIVKVKPGFARNYLLPQKKAMRATKENLAYFETQRAQLEANNLHRKSEASEIGTKLEGLTIGVRGKHALWHGQTRELARIWQSPEYPGSGDARRKGIQTRSCWAFSDQR
jgi:ribosomal protein L9